MPQFQINYTANLDADSPEAAQPIADAGAKALSEAGAAVSGISVISLVQPITVQVVDAKTQTIREETVLANDEEEARERLDLSANEFIPSKEEGVESEPAPTPVTKGGS